MTTKPKKPRKPRPSRAKHPRGPGDPKRGPMPWVPTPAEAKLIELYTGLGATQDQLALLMDKSVESLILHAGKSLKKGTIAANFQIAGKLFQRAMAGELGAIVWWEKTRSGMKDTSRHEHSGPNGGPIETVDLSRLTEQQLADYGRLSALASGVDPDMITATPLLGYDPDA